jgi:hypothetical protein
MNSPLLYFCHTPIWKNFPAWAENKNCNLNFNEDERMNKECKKQMC